MLMGAAEGAKDLKEVKPVLFEEDLTPDQRAQLLKEKTGVIIHY